MKTQKIMMTEEKIEDEIRELKSTLKWWDERRKETGNAIYRDHVKMIITGLRGELRAFQQVLNGE